MAKIDGRIVTLGAFILLLVILWLTPGFMRKTKSPYDVTGMNLDIFTGRGSQVRVDSSDMTANAAMSDTIPTQTQTYEAPQVQQEVPQQVAEDPVPLNAVSTSMLPRDIPSAEDFGAFSPDAILQGQNYLDPRAQIGYPETLGGNIRNANYDIRSEPVNPRVPVSIWNNSTIVPDLMRPQFEIGR
jgi:hypothetical protein